MRLTTDDRQTVGAPGDTRREASGARERELDRFPTDGEAFVRTLYTDYGAHLTQFAARKLGGDWHRAEDIVQEAAVRAWRHAGRLTSSTGDIRTWLFAVVRNLLIDEHRARQVRPGELQFSEAFDRPVLDQVEQILTAQVVTGALQDLTDQQREVLRSMYYRGHSVAQASQTLGIPPGTVKSRTYYAMRALRVALAARGVDAP